MSKTDPTFRNYTADQAASYGTHRGSYDESLYKKIIISHEKTGGSFEKLLDIGCGTGNSTRPLARYFQTVLGVDPGEQMIVTARTHGGKTASGKDVEYAVGEAEDLLSIPGLDKNSVDMIAAAMAAHWFDMTSFWQSAADVLKPGGTVALWTKSSLYCHPSTRNATIVQQHLTDLENKTLAPYELPANRISRHMYRTLLLPWDVSPVISCFPLDQLTRLEWDANGVLSDGDDFFGGSIEEPLSQLENSLGTASMVTRWREANPTKVGTEDDCVRATMHSIRKAMNISAGEDGHIRTGSSTALLLFKKM